MSRIPLTLGTALACALAFGQAAPVVSASGDEPVQINTQATSATAVNPSITVLARDGTTRVVSCRSMSLAAGITAAGAVTVPNGSARITGCTFLGTALTIVQTAAWTGSILHLDIPQGSLTSAFTLSLGTLRLTDPFPLSAHASGVGCEFDIGGGLLGDFAASTTHYIPINIPGMNFPASLADLLDLIVYNARGFGCSLLGLPFSQARLTASFLFTPAVNGMAI